jgi:cytochrome c peroxidase
VTGGRGGRRSWAWLFARRSDPANLNANGFPIPTPEARQAAIRLGKAFFWDMQVGSDGLQACATCHFHAGADNRTKNQVSAGLNGGDTTFQVTGPNGTLVSGMYPFHTYANPEDRFSPVLSDANDVVSCQGVHNTDFVALATGGVSDVGTVVPDPVFSVNGVNVRRVEPRNAPSVINAVFNFANIWDGRANNVFNGANPFGDADPDAGVWVNVNGTLQKQRVHIPMGSLASQAVGPPTSPFEMSFRGRAFSDIGQKLLANTGRKVIKLMPLANQDLHPLDSVLGPLSYSMVLNTSKPLLKPGLNTTYGAMIQAAFQVQYWNSTLPVSLGTDQFTQMEANFSLFFGLAVQLYEATLVSDDSPFDRFQAGDDAAMSPSAQAGLNIFLTQVEQGVAGGSCINSQGPAPF